MSNPATLTFVRFEVVKVLFDKTQWIDGTFDVNITHSLRIDLDNANHFFSEIIVTVKQKDSSFDLNVLSFGEFMISGDIDEIVYKNYTEISAPSIIYPYLRAFISSLTLLSGMKSIAIPPVNFANLPLLQAPPPDVPVG
jgi:preprotein translocase subunit SecB